MVVDVVDLSASAAPPAALPADALEATDSDLGAALRAAVARGAARIRLYTDGCDITGGVPWLPEVPVDVVLRPRRDDLALLDLRLPHRIQAGADFAVEIRVGRTAGPAAGPARVRVRLSRDGARVGAAAHLVVLGRGEARVLRVRDRVDRTDGLVRYRAELLDASVGDPGNDHREAVARVGDRPYVVAVSSAAPLAGFTVRRLRAQETAAFLRDAATRAQLDAILLGGPLPDLDAQREVVRAVHGGAGLVVVGGGGFGGRPLEAVLPLSDSPPGGRATVLLLDFSGSMTRSKPELLRAVEHLKSAFAPQDRIAFVAFRHEVFAQSGWSRVADARWKLHDVRPAGRNAARARAEGGAASSGRGGLRPAPAVRRQRRRVGGSGASRAADRARRHA